MNKALSILAIAAIAGGVQGQWDETGDGGGDAGVTLFGTAAQTTSGVGALTSITGTIDNSVVDDLDGFFITVTDADAFFASTDPNDGGSFIGNTGFEDDSRLWLFDTSGNLIMANDDNDDSSGTDSLESRIGNLGVQYDGPAFNSPGSVVDGATYILVIGEFSNSVVDAAGEEIADFSADFGALHGLNPLFDASTAQNENPGSFTASVDYNIVLGGATFAIPAPASAALLGLGGLAAARRRR
ncbi:MAG: hypothetical protein AAGF47_03995 [Planctomycetota bacterium]